MSEQYYIGWDVGGWSCTNAKRSSCDALVILNHEGELIGKPYRQSLKDCINTSSNATDFLQHCFEVCKLGAYQDEQVCLAIDTPLGYSTSFIELITGYTYHEKIGEYKDNPYLFRATERHLFGQGIVKENNKTVRPLSAVNDMIGAQSTKGIHLIAKLKMEITDFGVWKSADEKLTIIETYPAVNPEIEIPGAIKKAHQDIQDAYRCARIAYLFQEDPAKLVPPDLNEVDKREGWIWYLEKEEGGRLNKG